MTYDINQKRCWSLILITAFVFLSFVMLASKTLIETQPSKFRRNLQDVVIPTTNQYRIVAFGSSRTWGAAIDNPKQDAYPALMGAKNLAIRASGPEYPALCTYSLVGDDEIYDVVVIEYMLDWVSEALDILAERLRKRFPDAIFIFLDVWAPRQYYHKPTQKTLNTLVHEKMRSPIVTEQDIHQWLDATNSEDWGFEAYNSKVIEDAARKVGGHVVNLPSHPDPIIAIKTYSPLYVLTDMTHFSELGHQWVRDQILKILDNIKAQRSNRIVPWEFTDLCTSWYETGKTELLTNMEMVNFRDGSKFALEASHVPNTNFIELHNTWSGSGFLYLSYMSNGPEQIYPDTLVRVIHHKTSSAAMHLIPVIPNTPFGKNFHMVVHSFIGPVLPGLSNLTIDDLTQGTKEKFRIVGLVFSPHVFGKKLMAAL